MYLRSLKSALILGASDSSRTITTSLRRLYERINAQLTPDLTWFRVERESQNHSHPSLLIYRPILTQYLYFLSLSLIETVAFHVTATALARWWRGEKGKMVSTALLISSSARLIPVFMVIWSYDIPEAAGLVDWAVVVYNTEALKSMIL